MVQTRIFLVIKLNFFLLKLSFQPGDILAGYYAEQMGLPVGKLVCASNENNVLTDFLTTGTYTAKREFFKTTSPSFRRRISLLFIGMPSNK